MKHFIVEIIYKAEIEKINEIRPKHREFLKKGYDEGRILCSGPKMPRTGGIIIARGNSIEEISEFLSNDPYQKENAAEYQYTQFNPVHFQEFLKDWINE
jgi:uncharacterized protein YciI